MNAEPPAWRDSHIHNSLEETRYKISTSSAEMADTFLESKLNNYKAITWGSMKKSGEEADK